MCLNRWGYVFDNDIPTHYAFVTKNIGIEACQMHLFAIEGFSKPIENLITSQMKAKIKKFCVSFAWVIVIHKSGSFKQI